MAFHKLWHQYAPVLHLIDVVDKSSPKAHFHRQEQPVLQLVFYPNSKWYHRSGNGVISRTRIQPVRLSLTGENGIAKTDEAVRRVPRTGLVGKIVEKMEFHHRRCLKYCPRKESIPCHR